MEISARSPHRLNAPNTPPAPPSQSAPAPAPPDQDQIEVGPQRTPKQLFAALRELGKDPGRDAAARMLGSQKAGYESLIKFQGEEGSVVSLVSHEELAEYVALVGGPGVASEANQKAFTQLTQLTAEGDRFYLARGSKNLETDAAGAALVLARGEAVTRVRVGGERDEWKSLPETIERSPENKAALGRVLDQAKSLKCEVAPLPPEKEEPKSMLGKVVKALTSKPAEGIDLRGSLIGTLESEGKVLLSWDKDNRKIPLPMAVDGKQLEAFLNYLSSPDEDQKAFRQTYKDLTKDGTVVMQRNSQGEAKGMLLAASDKSAYLALLAGEEVVALTKDGIQHRLNKPEHLQELKANGTVAHGTPGTPHDAEQPSDNLFMVYSVSPFDPIKKGVYDDLLLRLTDVGSSPQIDIVAMHSDLPEKRNLRVDRVQPGKLESLKQMPPETVMSDPQVFEDFIAETLLANQTDGKIRLFVGGHGGAEKGLLPDGKHNNADANHAMSVDAFAQAIHKAVDRVEAETGKRPFIDNLMLCSCLMGNTSFIDALSQTGDIGVLCASPELMQGSNPNSVVEFLHDPKTSKSSGEEFAKFLVDTISEAPSAPGGSKESHHADTYGAYRLDKRLARQFRDSSEAFFQACLENPKEAAAIKRAIASTPTYGINPFLNLMFDVDNRDVIQVAERVMKDARVTDPKIKEACKNLIEAAEAQVITQKVSENYTGRRGPTIYLPIDRFDYDEKMGSTAFLKGTSYDKFMEMIFDAPLTRGVQDTFLAEANRWMEATKEAAAKNPAPAQEEEEKKVEESDEPAETKTATAPKSAKSPKVTEEVHSLEQQREGSPLASLGRVARGLVRLGGGLASGLVGAAIGGLTGVVIGTVLGARAGFTGHSKHAQAYGADEDPSTGSLAGLKKGWSLLQQAVLFPVEATGVRVHDAVGFRLGKWPGRISGTLAGAVGGALGGGLVGAGLGSIPGFKVGHAAASAATFWMPGQLPSKDHSQGRDSDLTVP